MAFELDSGLLQGIANPTAPKSASDKFQDNLPLLMDSLNKGANREIENKKITAAADALAQKTINDAEKARQDLITFNQSQDQYRDDKVSEEFVQATVAEMNNPDWSDLQKSQHGQAALDRFGAELTSEKFRQLSEATAVFTDRSTDPEVKLRQAQSVYSALANNQTDLAIKRYEILGNLPKGTIRTLEQGKDPNNRTMVWTGTGKDGVSEIRGEMSMSFYEQDTQLGRASSLRTQEAVIKNSYAVAAAKLANEQKVTAVKIKQDFDQHNIALTKQLQTVTIDEARSAAIVINNVNPKLLDLVADTQEDKLAMASLIYQRAVMYKASPQGIENGWGMQTSLYKATADLTQAMVERDSTSFWGNITKASNVFTMGLTPVAKEGHLNPMASPGAVLEAEERGTGVVPYNKQGALLWWDKANQRAKDNGKPLLENGYYISNEDKDRVWAKEFGVFKTKVTLK